ncbi:hypothetical protein AZE42_10322 [Rhizopogon vesiculosus]|uniref:Uncharacterized protein n=1 Tax=Rhizopogon vesiculosus TaxID=180088 RepID=A0A1J8R1K7_9AGAM|nr:hypothetical protein AZE42_10322 [Rhizopogon vesiculosus]
MCSPYARSVSPPPNLPAKLRRKSSSASINAPSSFNTDDEDLNSPSPSSPLPSSSPLQTPIRSSSPTHIATRYSHSYITLENSPYGTHMEFDDPPSSPTPLYPRGRSSKHVLNKYGRYLGNEDDILDYQPRSKHNSHVRLSPPSPAHDLPEDDGCDLESMNIHLRETYFATSSERGRWKSSPIIPRTSAAKPYMSGPIRPYRGQSTPVKSTPNTKSSLLEFREFVRRQSTSGVFEDPLRSPFLAASDHNDSEDNRSSSPLPPSSPPTSPMSLALSQPDDCVFINDDMNLDDDCSSDDFNFEQQNTLPVNSENVLPRDAPTPDPERPFTSEHASNAASDAWPSSCTNEATRQLLKFSPTVPLSINTITPTTTAAIEVPRSRSNSPAYVSLGLSAYTNIPSAVTPPLTKEGMRNVGRLAESQTVVPSSPVKTVKKPRLSFGSENEFVQGSSVAQPQPQLARRSSMSRPTSPLKDAGTIKESARPQPERKLKTGLKREDSVASVAPVQKRPRLSEDVDLDVELDACRKQRQRKQKTAADKARSRSVSRLKSKASEGDLGTQVAHIRDELQSPPASDSSCRSSAKPECIPTEPTLLDAEQVEFTGMLVEALATSRASSMDPFALHSALIQTHPHLDTKYDKKQWLKVIPAVLEAGRVRCGMFEKVHSSGTNGEKQARWFYLSEKDEDRERAGLLEELMPKQKRSETKKFKKYYYKPLNKISRWDSEDAI